VAEDRRRRIYNMRNPDRLDDFYSQLCEIHKKSFPDWRFGQLCSNFFGWLASEKKMDLFFPEESQMLTYLREFCGEENSNGEN
jgi:hypothetical protein